MAHHKIYDMSLASIYPHYITKAEKKERSKDDVDLVTKWLTGYSQEALEQQLEDKVSLKEFFDQAPELNPNRKLITGKICGVRVEDIEEPLMQEIRYLDKLVDEVGRGKKMENILRKEK
ncbi:DUF2200 domain-containing protein [Staphylococcus massiliensis]|uniref:DUF2200 domain-containing protein n=1 Tax=Staphylococcus massiliensis S46 TaxID=1229783 RepID=K9ARR6_9STAP|nr:DUF2200 domain-containing protein [Staphylococcus massiliensis]EKU50133.1 hypothetical protein C273_02653 [Staphylococcus massiliensis S46]MCG3402164.1 DUF2200 domain-containing protein [Staphylococcus massiliensis]POA00827.1 DUF2200 domain-containing protein [Staphylococcus massiliensis CCUG 55927]